MSVRCAGTDPNRDRIVRKIPERRDKWTQSNTCMFVLMLKAQRLLWDPRDEEYDNASARHNVLAEMVKDLREPWLTVPVLERKLNTLRLVYKRELYKTLRDPEFESRIEWFKCADGFMREAVTASQERLEDAFFHQSEIIEKKPQINTTHKPKRLNSSAKTNLEKDRHTPEKRQRLYRLSCFMVLNELLEQHEKEEAAAAAKSARTRAAMHSRTGNPVPEATSSKSTMLNTDCNLDTSMSLPASTSGLSRNNTSPAARPSVNASENSSSDMDSGKER